MSGNRTLCRVSKIISAFGMNSHYVDCQLDQLIYQILDQQAFLTMYAPYKRIATKEQLETLTPIVYVLSEFRKIITKIIDNRNVQRSSSTTTTATPTVDNERDAPSAVAEYQTANIDEKNSDRIWEALCELTHFFNELLLNSNIVDNIKHALLDALLSNLEECSHDNVRAFVMRQSENIVELITQQVNDIKSVFERYRANLQNNYDCAKQRNKRSVGNSLPAIESDTRDAPSTTRANRCTNKSPKRAKRLNEKKRRIE